MLNTSARLLRLLALMQSRPTWTAAELADRLSVSARTIRTDIDRLRELGYPITGTRGSAGGYRLGAGAQMPPLLLDDDEAVAVALSLSALAPRNISGVEESAARALSKLEQVIPSRLRQQVTALRATTEQPRASHPARPTEPAASSADLAAIATAIHVGEWCRFRYTRATPRAEETDELESRRVEPYRLVSWSGRWYLVAFDLDRDDWRTFRVDRMRLGGRTFRPFTARSLPDDASTLVLRGVANAGWNARARVIVHAPATEVLERIDPTVGTVEVLTESTSALLTGADSLERIAAYLGMLGRDFTVDHPDELVPLLRTIGSRYLAAAPPPRNS